MCNVLGVSASAYYEWEHEQESLHERRDAELLALIRTVFARFRGRYGAPRIQRRLAEDGVRVSRKRVARLMREAGLRAKGARKYKATTDSKHSLPVAPNLLERRFSVDQPNVAWVSDITYLWTRQGWMYLAVIIDLFSRKVVGWSLRERMTAELVCEALLPLWSNVGRRRVSSSTATAAASTRAACSAGGCGATACVRA